MIFHFVSFAVFIGNSLQLATREQSDRYNKKECPHNTLIFVVNDIGFSCVNKIHMACMDLGRKGHEPVP